MALTSERDSIYSEYKKINKGITPVDIPKSEALLSSLLSGNVVNDVKLLQPSEYFKNKQPFQVDVSSLLSTWETAFLLFLPFLRRGDTDTNPDYTYTPTLYLVVSPFLQEKENIVGFNDSNLPGNVTENVKQFLKFIDLYILLSNMPGHEGDNTEIKKNFESYPKIFNLIVEFSPISKLYVSVNTIDPASIVFKYDLTGIEFYRVKEIKDDDIVISDDDLVINEDDDEDTKDEKNKQIKIKKEEIKNQKIDEENLKKTNTEKSKKEEIESYVQIRVSLSGDNITYIKSILDSISTATSTPPLPPHTTTSNDYVKYSDAPGPVPINLPFALTQMDESNFDNFDTFSVYFPDIFNYLKWVINIKKHPKNIPIFVVSHSGTMQNFLKKIFYCLNNNSLLPSQTFIDTYTYCTKTNLWSLRLYYMGYNIIIFRHGFTCDNMYKEATIVFARASGIYSNLSIWGILSIGKFYNLNKNILTNITGINKNNILSVMYGVPKQSKSSITSNLPNEITCGKDIRERFNHSQHGDSYFYLPSPPINTTELQKYMQLIHVKSVLSSDIDSDVDKDIQELISVEFINCPGGNLFSSTFGCIKLACVYNKRYVTIRPYTDKMTKPCKYETTFYNIDPDSNDLVVYEKTNVEINNELKNILEYEKIILYLIDYQSQSNLDSFIHNFNISSIANILINTTMKRVIEMLQKGTQHRIDVNLSLYYPSP
jgi:hypothetical protein